MINPVLSVRNKNSRDDFIRFYNKGHKYEIMTDPNSKYTSVTTWCHSHFPKFDPDAVVNLVRETMDIISCAYMIVDRNSVMPEVKQIGII